MQSRGGWLRVITTHCSSSSSAPSPPVSLFKHDRTPTRYLKLETDGIGERCECSTTRQVGKLESLMEQIGFCERLLGWHTQPASAWFGWRYGPFLTSYPSESPDVTFNDKDPLPHALTGCLSHRQAKWAFQSLPHNKEKSLQHKLSLFWLCLKYCYDLCHLITKPS